MGMDSFWQYVAKGAVIIAAVYFDYYKNKITDLRKH
jgi:predicted ABC-type sugar transport system permease subunit